MSADSAPQITVIYPATDVRGRAAEHLRAWTMEQTLPTNRYRVIAVLESGSLEESAVRGVLRPGQTVLTVPNASDIAMWNAGAARAETDWLVFAEGHSPGAPDCLAAIDHWLAGNPAADAGNIAIGHRDSYLMAQLSARWFGEQQARWRAEWPRLHRAGFAIRRAVFEKMGGFQPLGQFGPPLLSARLHAAGHPVLPIPDATVIHIDDETVRDHHHDTIDFVVHECAARETEDPVFFERYFGHQSAWRNRLAADAGTALRAAWAAVHSALLDRDRPRGLFRAALRLLPRSFRDPRILSALGPALTAVDETLLPHLPLPADWRYRWFVDAHRRVVTWNTARWVIRRPVSEAAGLGPGHWPIHQIPPETIGGLHGLEHHNGHPFRWTGELVRIRLSPGRRERRLRLHTGGLRPRPREAVLLAACGPHPLPRYCLRTEPGGILTLRMPKRFWKHSARHGLTLLFKPLPPASQGPPDPRPLGIPLFSVESD